MRLIHTSDWHLGQEWVSYDRSAEQQAFLDWLLAKLVETGADALLVAGDLYDTVNPSVAAQSMLARFLVDLRTRLPHCTVIAIAGNHDSGARVELPQPFASALGGIHLVGSVRHDDPESLDRAIIPLCNASGEIPFCCIAMPFLRASDVDARIREGETPETAFVRGVALLQQDLCARARKLCGNVPLVSMAHLTVAGSDRAGSERLLIGGVEAIPATILTRDCVYTALGHIHRPQVIHTADSVSGPVRYCGSPYPVAFDEHRYAHQIVQVDLDGSGNCAATPLEIPILAPYVAFGPAPWVEVEAAIRKHTWSAGPEGVPPAWVQVSVVLDAPVPDLRGRVEELLRGSEARLVSVSGIHPGDDMESKEPRERSLDLKSADAPLALFRDLYRTRYSGAEAPEDLVLALREIMDQIASGREGR